MEGSGEKSIFHPEPFFPPCIYVFGSSSGVQSDTPWRGESDQANTRFGSSVGTAGDVNDNDQII